MVGQTNYLNVQIKALLKKGLVESPLIQAVICTSEGAVVSNRIDLQRASPKFRVGELIAHSLP